jgi:hypothetical protein
MNKSFQYYDKRSFWWATAVGLFILVLFGYEYRKISKSLSDSASESFPLAGTLAFIPMNLRDWQGRDIPLESTVVKALAVDDYINRSYSRYSGMEKVELFITCGRRIRDLMPHRPEVCYPSNGWSLRDSEQKLLRLDDGWSFECKIFQFDRSGLGERTVLVLNYYVVDGEYVPDLSSVRSTLWQNFKSLEYLLQVQIVCESTSNDVQENTTDLLVSFALESAQAVRTILPGSHTPAVASIP